MHYTLLVVLYEIYMFCKLKKKNKKYSDEPTKSLGIKPEYTPRTVVRLVNLLSFVASDWTVNLRNERLHYMITS